MAFVLLGSALLYRPGAEQFLVPVGPAVYCCNLCVHCRPLHVVVELENADHRPPLPLFHFFVYFYLSLFQFSFIIIIVAYIIVCYCYCLH